MVPSERFGYQEYPRMLHGPKGQTLTVNSDEEKAAALEQGWCLHPDEVSKPRGRPKKEAE